MSAMGNHAARKGSLAPTGYIRIEDAAQIVGRRMFSQEMPEDLLIATKKNVEDASIRRAHQFGTKLKHHPIEVGMDLPLKTLVTAITSGDIALFAMTENCARIFAISQNIAADVLARAGFPRTFSTIYLRFMDMMPMTLVRDLQVGELQRSASKTFALILKESEFEDWLGHVARQDRWPLDKKARKAVGRPDRVSAVKPLVKLFVESGKWQSGNPFKQLTSLVNAKLKGQEASRGTIERALTQLYAETRDHRYRHKKRKRRASPKANKRR